MMAQFFKKRFIIVCSLALAFFIVSVVMTIFCGQLEQENLSLQERVDYLENELDKAEAKNKERYEELQDVRKLLMNLITDNKECLDNKYNLNEREDK